MVVAQIANEHLRIGDVEPPFLPHASTIRNIKNRHDQNKLSFHKDPIVSLREMKYAAAYLNTIGSIGLDPFDCHFSTPYQKELLRTETNRNKIIISIDATGAPVRKPKTSSYSIEHGKFKPIFLYVIMLQGKGGNLPVYQVLSQRQDATNIRLMLETWQQSCLGGKHPQEIITDNSAALLLACAKAFAHCQSMTDYDNKCYYALQGGDLPKSYIRLDRTHTVKSIMRMASNLDRNKKKF